MDRYVDRYPTHFIIIIVVVVVAVAVAVTFVVHCLFHFYAIEIIR